jgi:molybdate transport system ATP-binding protein
MLRTQFRRHLVDVDLAIDLTGVTVLFGPSGAGKTTMLRAIAGLDIVDEGRIVVNDVPWTVDQRLIVPPRKRNIGYLFQDHALFPHLSVAANVGYGLPRHARAHRDAVIAEALRQTKTDHLIDRRVADLSGGEAQRVALARAIAPRPSLLLLDEPLSALDTPTRVALRSDLRRLLVDQHLPAIVVTHDRAEALALGDHIVVLVDGRVRQQGPPAQVFDRPADPSVASVLGVETATPAVVSAVHAGVVEVNADGRMIMASSDASTPLEVGDHVLACIRAEDIALAVGDHVERTSQRNRIGAQIRAISAEGPLVRVDLDAGFGLTAYITRPALEDLELTEGSPVSAVFKSQAVHLIPR